MSSAVGFNLFPTSAMQQIFLYLHGTENARRVPVICKLWETNLSLLETNKKRASDTRFSDQPRIVMVYGMPGSGKGTFGQRLEGFEPFSLGDRFRRLVEEGMIGEEYRTKIVNHEPIPLDLVHGVVKKELEDMLQQGKRVVIDGFPREQKSIQFFDDLMRANGLEERDIVAVHLKVSPEIAKERSISRLTCKKCMQIYNTKLSPPESCCGALLKPRLDAHVQGRQDGFAKKFAPPLEHYKACLLEIDGNHPPAEIMKQFQQRLEEFRPPQDYSETSRKKARPSPAEPCHAPEIPHPPSQEPSALG